MLDESRRAHGGRHSRSRRTRGGGRHRYRPQTGLSYVIVPAGLALAILVVVATFLLISDVTTSFMIPLR